MEKRPAESEENGGGENGAKKAKLDPECGRLLFCGSTNWELMQKVGKLKEDTYYSKQNIYEPHFISRDGTLCKKFLIAHYLLKELMVHLQTFTTCDYLFKNNCFDNNKLQNRKKKWEKNYFILMKKQKYIF